MEIETITTYRLPPNFTSRSMCLDDAAQAVELFNTFTQKYLGVNTENLEDDLVFWQTPGFNLDTDSCVVFNEQQKMVGYGEFWDIVEPHVRFNIEILVHPDYEDLGIDSYLLAWVEQRAQSALTVSPPGTLVVLQQGEDSRMKKNIAFIQDHGFKLVRNFYHMHIDLDQEPALPEIPVGYEIRPYHGEDERREMIRVLWESFKDHWGFVDEPFENYLERWLHWAENIKNMDPSLWYIAVKDGEIAGGCLCMSERTEDPQMGWVNMLGVLRKHRKNGLGLALLQQAFAEFYRRGKKRAGLGVDATNLTGALALYEKAGMHVARNLHSFQKVLREGVDITTSALHP